MERISNFSKPPSNNRDKPPNRWSTYCVQDIILSAAKSPKSGICYSTHPNMKCKQNAKKAQKKETAVLKGNFIVGAALEKYLCSSKC